MTKRNKSLQNNDENILCIKKQNEEYKNRIKELEKIIKEKDKIIQETKKNNDLYDKIIELQNLLKNNVENNSIKELEEGKIIELKNLLKDTFGNNKIKELEDEIKLFRQYYSFSPEENLIPIKIISVDQQINCDIIAKTTDLFSKIEGDLYNKYDKYKSTENYFLVNGNKVNRHKTLKDNQIKDNDILTLCIIDE